jgi:hypothetical protein
MAETDMVAQAEPAERTAELGETFALVGHFDTPAELMHACEKIRDAGYQKFDAHTPFPVHGLERAMGLGPSRLPFIVLGGGLCGAILGFGLQWWVHSQAYPINYSGKPYFAFQAYVPITFELTVLLSAFACFFGMWLMNGLPRFHHPVHAHIGFERFSDDKFFISIEAADPKFDLEKTRALLHEVGAQGIGEVRS